MFAIVYADKIDERVIYKMLKEYIEDKYGFRGYNTYIAEAKRELGLTMYDVHKEVYKLK